MYFSQFPSALEQVNHPLEDSRRLLAELASVLIGPQSLRRGKQTFETAIYLTENNTIRELKMVILMG
jgi:hypothetical protein